MVSRAVFVNNIEPLERLRKRLAHIKSLEKGWYWHGEGEVISEQAIDQTSKLIDERPDLASYYRLYPIPEGGISIEFEKFDLLVSISIDNQGEVDIFGLSTDQNPEIEFERAFISINAEFLELFDKHIPRDE
jgi:hypothetical protein